MIQFERWNPLVELLNAAHEGGASPATLNLLLLSPISKFYEPICPE